jgi:DotD protein
MILPKKLLGFALLAALITGFLAGCATPPAAGLPDSAAVDLDSALQLKSKDKPLGPETVVAPPVYGAQTTVSFLGDASILLVNATKGMGDGWVYQQSGPTPHLPIYIQINVKNMAFTAFLQSIAEQLGQRADIELNGKTIKLVYRTPT